MPEMKVTKYLIRERLVVVRAMRAFAWARDQGITTISMSAIVQHSQAKDSDRDLGLILEAARRSRFKMVEGPGSTVVFRPYMKRGRKPKVRKP